MSGNIDNLTYGLRRLKFQTTLGNSGAIIEDIAAVAQNFARDIRDEVLNDATVLLKQRAIFYIEENRKLTLVPRDNPRSQGLTSSFRSFHDSKDRVEVSMGVGVDYAVIHNLARDEVAVIQPTNSFMLIFHWYRFDKLAFAGEVHRPGVAYWDRAVIDVQLAMKSIMGKHIKYFASRDAKISKRTGARLRGPRRLALSASDRNKSL